MKKTYVRDASKHQNISPFTSQFSRNQNRALNSTIEKKENSPIPISNRKSIKQQSEVRESENKNDYSPIKRTPSLGKMFNQISSKFERINALKDLEQSMSHYQGNLIGDSEKKLRPHFIKKFTKFDISKQRKVIKHLEKIMKKKNIEKFQKLNFHHFENLVNFRNTTEHEEREPLMETARKEARIASMDKNEARELEKFTTIKDSELI